MSGTVHRLRRRYGRAGANGVATPWPADEARRHQASARRAFTEGHSYKHRGVDADNCSYCALTHGGSDGPNYSGWARLYIEAQRPIPKKWRGAFESELASDNRAYADALARSIATFGGPRFR